ncbi:MAG: beta-ketoacyl-[acyl-carrier-protein] synthase family protein [Chitinophagales bacterium]
MIKRVVITGMGVVAPNAVGLADFEAALKEGKSGIQFIEELKELKFSCQVGGIPPVTLEHKQQYFSDLELSRLKANGVLYGCIAGMDAWKDAGLTISDRKTDEADWDSGCIMGAGLASARAIRYAMYMIDELNTRRLGSTITQQTMSSGVSAYLGGMLGLGNQVTTNASACSTGTEAIIMGAERIRLGKAKRMLCGGCDSAGAYVWAGFDAMRVLNRRSNDNPEYASRPMSATATGFVPGGGAGALLLEDLESALERNAPIYAEVLGGFTNSGGQRNAGSMTAPNVLGIERCILGALQDAGIEASEVDAISGHLTSTMFDPGEVASWSKALQRTGTDFPYISALKSMIGHCLSAAGAIEAVAAVLQLKGNFLHPSLNCEDLHPEIAAVIDPKRIPQTFQKAELNIFAKSSFGFGDVNSCVIFKKY